MMFDMFEHMSQVINAYVKTIVLSDIRAQQTRGGSMHSSSQSLQLHTLCVCLMSSYLEHVSSIKIS